MNIQSNLSIHEGPIPLDVGLPENSKIGVLKIKTPKIRMDETPVFIQFTLDQSGSMVEGNGSKLKCLKETMINLLSVIVKYEMPIWIAIDVFDTVYRQIVSITQVRSDNIIELQDKISSIQADGNTNLEETIKKSQKALEEANNFDKKYNFLLTDGEATVGQKSNTKLCDLITDKFPTIFIGYGEYHNSKLLINGSKKHINSSYHLVTDFETIGILCGELLNEICYPVLNEVVISTSGELDKIFDPKINKWCNKLKLGHLVAEKEYTFLLFTNDFEYDIINISGTEPLSGNIYFSDLDFQDNFSISNLTINIFQHKVNSLLQKTSKEESIYIGLKELFSIIHKYARENDLLEDPVFLVMFEDLYIAYTKFYDNNSDMYNYSRLSSNTRNQYYRANISMETQQEFLEQCLRTPTFSGTYDYMNYKLDESYIEPIKEETITPEIETVDDIDSINNYVSQTKMIDLNITQTQMMFSRDVSVGTQI
jgi:uncharacterized protein YegL